MLKEKGASMLKVDFPEYGKDPCDWKPEDIEKALQSRKGIKVNITKI